MQELLRILDRHKWISANSQSVRHYPNDVERVFLRQKHKSARAGSLTDKQKGKEYPGMGKIAEEVL